MADFMDQYFTHVIEVLKKVSQESGGAIREAADKVAQAIENDHDLLFYGSGHSALVAREATGRAGGLIQAMLVEDIADGDAERLEGMGALIIGRYALRAGSVLIIISNSGINPVPIEIAQIAKVAGLTVVAITNLAHSRSILSRHSSGKKLYELADIVIDTHGVPGDAGITLNGPGEGMKTGATSTVVGAAIVEAITVQAAAKLAERNIIPPIIVSANLPEGDDHNAKLMERYGARLVRSSMSAHFSMLVNRAKHTKQA